MRPVSCSWEELTQFCEDLLSLRREGPSPSRALIALNQLYQKVEAYLADKGFQVDASGQWPMHHPSYGLFCQLAECIESCKEQEFLLDEHLACFIREILIPELYQQWEFRLVS